MKVLNFCITIWMLHVGHNVGIISINCVSCYSNENILQPAVGIIQECVQTRQIDEYQYDTKLLKSDGVQPGQDLAQEITNIFMNLQNFTHLHLMAVQRSQNVGVDSKNASHTYIANALSNFVVAACRLVTDDKNSNILDRIKMLALNTKIQIVIDAIRAKASFKTPLIPTFDMRRDIVDFNKPPCGQTVIVAVLGRLRFEVRLKALNQIHTLIDQHVVDDFNDQHEFMVTEVMKQVIGNAPNLSQGERNVRWRNVVDMKNTIDFIGQIQKFMKDYEVSMEKMCDLFCKPGNNCRSGLVYINNLRLAYPSIAWGKFGEKLFANYEEVSLSPLLPEFRTIFLIQFLISDLFYD